MMFDAELAQALDFTEADLATNRQGKMTVAQQARLRGDFMRKIVYQPLGILVLWLGVWGVIFVTGVLGSVSQMMDEGVAFVILPPVLWFGISAFYNWRKLTSDLQTGAVATQDGHITLNPRTQNRVQIASRIYYLNKEALTSFINDSPYRIYYAPHTKVIISAEPMDDNQA